MFPDECQKFRWSRFKNLGSAEEMYDLVINGVFPFIKNLHQDGDSAYARYMGDADSKGDLYEYLLSKVATAGTNGQFRTPRHIIKMMVALVKPRPDDTIIDPAMGSAGFLIEAQQYLRENHAEMFLNAELRNHFNNSMFYGNDMDRTMLRIGAMNMLLHGVDNPDISYRDSLSEQNKDIERYSLFLALFLRILKKGGRAAVIVPDGVLFGSSKAHKEIRKEILEHNKLEAVISMPSGVFKPYAGVSTAILIFTKTGSKDTDKVWFYDMKADGYSLDDKRQEIAENDIPDIIERFSNRDKETERARTEQSFFVPLEEIVSNDYDLSINKYKEIVYEKIEYELTEVILGKIEELEGQIQEELAELKKLLSR